MTIKKKILITGSNGFLGNLAKEYFIQNYELVLVDLYNSSDTNFYKADIGNFTEIDDVITKDEEAMLATLRKSLDISDKQHASFVAKFRDSIK